jgi:DNA-binding GntR family transcriptional regulator
MFKKQKRITLKSQALNQIKKAIIAGDFKPGDRIVETRLAKEMGISKFPIREALRYLEKEGLVVNTPYQGTRVSHFNERDIEELYSLRSVLEELAVRLLMDKIDEVKVKRLDSILIQMKKAVDEKRIDKVISEDMLFHRTICELSGHRKLLDVWSTLEDQIKSFISLEEHFGEQSNLLVETHHAVLEAIKAGDTLLAQKCLREHLKTAVDTLKNIR